MRRQQRSSHQDKWSSIARLENERAGKSVFINAKLCQLPIESQWIRNNFPLGVICGGSHQEEHCLLRVGNHPKSPVLQAKNRNTTRAIGANTNCQIVNCATKIWNYIPVSETSYGAIVSEIRHHSVFRDTSLDIKSSSMTSLKAKRIIGLSCTLMNFRNRRSTVNEKIEEPWQACMTNVLPN